jgi:hypothetical protein
MTVLCRSKEFFDERHFLRGQDAINKPLGNNFYLPKAILGNEPTLTSIFKAASQDYLTWMIPGTKTASNATITLSYKTNIPSFISFAKDGENLLLHFHDDVKLLLNEGAQSSSQLENGDLLDGISLLTALSLLFDYHKKTDKKECSSHTANALYLTVEAYAKVKMMSKVELKYQSTLEGLAFVLRHESFDTDNLLHNLLLWASEAIQLTQPAPNNNVFDSNLCVLSKEAVLKYCVWYLSASQFKSPVPLEKARLILTNNAFSKDEQAAFLLAEVDSYDMYNSVIEKENAYRLAKLLRKNGKHLTVSRFGRASYFLVMLASASRMITGDCTLLNEQVKAVLKIIEDYEVSVPSTSELLLRKVVCYLLNSVASVKDYCYDLIAAFEQSATGTPISVAYIYGISKSLTEQLLRIQQNCLQQIYDIGKERLLWKAEIRLIRIDFQQLISSLWEMIDDFESLLVESSLDVNHNFRESNFSVLVQRASTTGVRALNHLRLGNDPFEGLCINISFFRNLTMGRF